jgi:hypothetical protein
MKGGYSRVEERAAEEQAIEHRQAHCCEEYTQSVMIFFLDLEQ